MYTRTAMCTTYDTDIIPAGRAGEFTLQTILQRIPEVCEHMKLQKRHKTAGFYGMLVRNSVKLHQHVSSGKKGDLKLEMDCDMGGFRDVGRHTETAPLSTCWPLVEQVFHCLGEQVRDFPACPFLH